MVVKKNWRDDYLIQNTSLEAYLNIQPHLGKMQNAIYNILKFYPDSSNHDISQILKTPINSITPRIKELRDYGLVEFSKYKIDPITNRKVMCWKIVC